MRLKNGFKADLFQSTYRNFIKLYAPYSNMEIAQVSPTIVMEFDMNTIEHLGIAMYSKLPPVLGELVANCWDADASEVKIQLYDEIFQKQIEIHDNGHGMTIDDINEKFLKIGKNRRLVNDRTPNDRKIIGKKGIGKLSVFGIAEKVYVTTRSSGVENEFAMVLSDIKTSGTTYHPNHTIVNKITTEKDGTIIKLSNIRRKSAFDVSKIVQDLAKRFLIYDKNFFVSVIYNNDKPIKMNNNTRFNDIKRESEWEFPNKNLKTKYKMAGEVVGKVYAGKDSLKASMQGIFLMARGKLVHTNDFYGVAFEYAHAYLTGWLNIDFIDENERDLISTNRESLNWENDKTEELNLYLQQVVKFVTKEWRKKRTRKRKEKIDKVFGVDIETWLRELPKSDQKLAKKITNVIYTSQKLDDDKCADLLGYIKDSFGFVSFKDFAATIEDFKEENQEEFIKFFKDWRLTEAKELCRLALVRIEVIKKFEELIKEQAKEVPTMHQFFKVLPWLLDPRIMNFEDEITYSNLLKEKYIETDVIEKNRRIDFLCMNFSNTLFIIELKRPGHQATNEDLEQILDYRSFISKYIGTDKASIKSTEVYLICGGWVNTRVVNDKIKMFSEHRMYVQTYHVLLKNALGYHKEFIKKYDEIKGLKGN